MTGFMVGDFSFKGGADILYFQDIDQVLGKLEDPETQFLRPPPPLRLLSKKFRIVNLNHAYTGTGRTDYLFVIPEYLNKMFGRLFCPFTISGIDSRLAAAGLFPMVDRIDPEPTQQGYCCFSDMGKEKVNHARDKKGYRFHLRDIGQFVFLLHLTEGK
jgi:hypothetical protein